MRPFTLKTPADYRIFLEQLQLALADLGIPSELNLKVPGSRLQVDLFLPRLPRAAVEVKFAHTPTALVEGLRQLERMQQKLGPEFGASFRSILLLLCPPGKSFRPSSSLPKGTLCLVLEHEQTVEKTVESMAREIQKALDDERKALFGKGVGLTAGLAAAGLATAGVGAVGTVAGMASLLTPMGWFAGGALLLGGKELFSKGKGWDSEEAKVIKKPRPRVAPEIPSQPMVQVAPPPPAEEADALAAQVATILETFRDLAPESHPMLVHEMGFLVMEFRQGHFTACALRAGRSLEFMVYELSRRWGIEIQDSAFGALQDLRSRLDRVGDLVGDFQIAPEGQQKKVEASLDQALVDLASRTMALALAVKQPTETNSPREELGPRSVATLLKKIRTRHGKLEGVAENLNALIDKEGDMSSRSLVGRILKIRNRAAHADVNGQNQEIDQDAVQALLEDISVLMLKLSNVGVAIRRAEVEADRAGGKRSR